MVVTEKWCPKGCGKTGYKHKDGYKCERCGFEWNPVEVKY